jgi:hypothetical protein
MAQAFCVMGMANNQSSLCIRFPAVAATDSVDGLAHAGSLIAFISIWFPECVDGYPSVVFDLFLAIPAFCVNPSGGHRQKCFEDDRGRAASGMSIAEQRTASDVSKYHYGRSLLPGELVTEMPAYLPVYANGRILNPPDLLHNVRFCVPAFRQSVHVVLESRLHIATCCPLGSFPLELVTSCSLSSTSRSGSRRTSKAWVPRLPRLRMQRLRSCPHGTRAFWRWIMRARVRPCVEVVLVCVCPQGSPTAPLCARRLDARDAPTQQAVDREQDRQRKDRTVAVDQPFHRRAAMQLRSRLGKGCAVTKCLSVSNNQYERLLCLLCIPPDLRLLCQNYLRLLNAYTDLYHVLYASSWTVPQLLNAQKAAVDFVALYTAFAEGIVIGDHVAPSDFGTASSTTFPKLHAVLHFVHYIYLLGPIGAWTTANFESALRVYCKGAFRRTNKSIVNQEVDMHRVVRTQELLQFRVRW